jgi:hypothetical protein
MIFDGEFTELWGPDEIRESRFCFIGKNLDRNQARDRTCCSAPPLPGPRGPGPPLRVVRAWRWRWHAFGWVMASGLRPGSPFPFTRRRSSLRPLPVSMATLPEPDLSLL